MHQYCFLVGCWLLPLPPTILSPSNKPQYLPAALIQEGSCPRILGFAPNASISSLLIKGVAMFTDKSLSNHRYILTNHKPRSVGQRGPQRNAEGFLSPCSEDSAKFLIQVSGCPALAAPASGLSNSHIPVIGSH